MLKFSVSTVTPTCSCQRSRYPTRLSTCSRENVRTLLWVTPLTSHPVSSRDTLSERLSKTKRHSRQKEITEMPRRRTHKIAPDLELLVPEDLAQLLSLSTTSTLSLARMVGVLSTSLLTPTVWSLSTFQLMSAMELC